MLTTQLILIEGLPGAGKSTSTVHLGTVLRQHGIPCNWFQEQDNPHPISCFDFEIKGLSGKMIPLWTNFVQHAIKGSLITIIESRLWQNTALFMYMSEVNVEEIIAFQQQVSEVLAPLSPALIYIDQDNTKIALRRMYITRGENWMEDVLRETTQYRWFQSRGLTDFAGWVRFFEEWHCVAESLYNDWPFNKTKITNPHENWGKAYEQMYAFLQIDEKEGVADSSRLELIPLHRSITQIVSDSRIIKLEGFNMLQNSYDYSTRKGIHPISWEDFHGICKALALSVSQFHPEIIIPIGRGGYYPGTLLAHLLQVEIYPVRVSRRINDVVIYKEPQWIVAPPAEIVQRRILVVDEICDSGETILMVRERCLALGASLVKSAVLYAHTKAVHVPDYIGIITDELLLNPWDREIFQDGEFHFNPEYVEALAHQGVKAKPELLMPTRIIQLAKE